MLKDTKKQICFIPQAREREENEAKAWERRSPDRLYDLAGLKFFLPRNTLKGTEDKVYTGKSGD